MVRDEVRPLRVGLDERDVVELVRKAASQVVPDLAAACDDDLHGRGSGRGDEGSPRDVVRMALGLHRVLSAPEDITEILTLAHASNEDHPLVFSEYCPGAGRGIDHAVPLDGDDRHTGADEDSAVLQCDSVEGLGGP